MDKMDKMDKIDKIDKIGQYRSNKVKLCSACTNKGKNI